MPQCLVCPKNAKNKYCGYSCAIKGRSLNHKGINVDCPRRRCNKISYRYPSQINRYNDYCSKQH